MWAGLRADLSAVCCGFPAKQEHLRKDELGLHKATLRCGDGLICTLGRRHGSPAFLPARPGQAGLGWAALPRGALGWSRGLREGCWGSQRRRSGREVNPRADPKGSRLLLTPYRQRLGILPADFEDCSQGLQWAVAPAVANTFCRQS